jgi:hypothetical protein
MPLGAEAPPIRPMSHRWTAVELVHLAETHFSHLGTRFIPNVGWQTALRLT